MMSQATRQGTGGEPIEIRRDDFAVHRKPS
jgi:hypothetical protein